MKEKDLTPSAGEIDAAEHQGPDRREASSDTNTTITSVRLRFDADGKSVWEPATDQPQRRSDDETVRLLTALNEEPEDDSDGTDSGDTIGHRTLMAFDAGDE